MTREIIAGQVYVPELAQSNDSLGEMNVICQHCGAHKFKKETKGLCCNDGNIQLTPFPPPPEEILQLWLGSNSEAQLFQNNCRALNNAVPLASLCATELRMSGFCPSIIFQGKVVQKMGPLRCNPGYSPTFAQLYILDAGLETTKRFENLSLPSNMSRENMEKMKSLLDKCQKVIHDRNPYVKDFKQVIEIPEDELEGGKIVISAAARPQHGHERVYNAQVNLQELSIVTNEKPHDLVINLREGSIQTISDMNSKAMPLHFTLLFIDGTPGWSKDLTHSDGYKRTTAREFYAFHMHKRMTDSDYLLHGRRLYQEWQLCGYTMIENQRLRYLMQNQSTLRADTYQNVREAIETRSNIQDSMYHNEAENAIGRIILPSSYTGSPGYYNKKFQLAESLDYGVMIKNAHKF